MRATLCIIVICRARPFCALKLNKRNFLQFFHFFSLIVHRLGLQSHAVGIRDLADTGCPGDYSVCGIFNCKQAAGR